MSGNVFGTFVKVLLPRTKTLNRDDLIVLTERLPTGTCDGSKAITVEDFLHEVARLIKEDREKENQ